MAETKRLNTEDVTVVLSYSRAEADLLATFLWKFIETCSPADYPDMETNQILNVARNLKDLEMALR